MSETLMTIASPAEAGAVALASLQLPDPVITANGVPDRREKLRLQSVAWIR